MSEKDEKGLKKEGWIKMFTTSEPRLSECIELYKSLGYEVHLEPAKFGDSELCKACYEFEHDRCKTIYVRKKDLSSRARTE